MAVAVRNLAARNVSGFSYLPVRQHADTQVGDLLVAMGWGARRGLWVADGWTFVENASHIGPTASGSWDDANRFIAWKIADTAGQVDHTFSTPDDTSLGHAGSVCYSITGADTGNPLPVDGSRVNTAVDGLNISVGALVAPRAGLALALCGGRTPNLASIDVTAAPSGFAFDYDAGVTDAALASARRTIGKGESTGTMTFAVSAGEQYDAFSMTAVIVQQANQAPSLATSITPANGSATGKHGDVPVSAVFSDPDGDNGRARFYWNAGGGWSGVYEGTTVASGGTSTATLTGIPANATITLHTYTIDSHGAQSGPVETTFLSNRSPAAPVVASPNGGETFNTVHDITWTGGADPDGQTTTVNIELTTDNGASWTRLVTGTPNDGAFTYDFTNVAASTACRVRTQSVDTQGLASPWDESNANFTILHNRPPDAPSQGAPANGTTLDRAIVQRFYHTPNDPDAGDTQSKVDFEYRLVGAAAWTQITHTTTNHFVDVAAGTFAVGDYERRTRTYDAQGEVSPYSEVGFFSAADVPPGATILTPGNNGTISKTQGVVEWSYPTQQAYEFRRVADNAGNPDTAIVYEFSGTVASTTARNRAVSYDVNNRAEHVQIRIQDANGLWTAWTSHRVTVGYTAPAVPLVTVTPRKAVIDVKVRHHGPNLMWSDAGSSFEDATTGSWAANAEATATNDTEWAAHGVRSLKVTPTATTTSNDTYAGRGPGFGLSGMVPGKTYTISAVRRLAAALTGTLHPRSQQFWVWFADAAGAYTAMGGSTDIGPENGGTATKLTFTVPADAVNMDIRLYNGATAGGGSVWWDQIQIDEGTERLPFRLPSTPDISTVHIYRREAVGQADTKRIATSVDFNGLFTDKTPAANVEYEYQAVAIGVNETSTDSDWTP